MSENQLSADDGVSGALEKGRENQEQSEVEESKHTAVTEEEEPPVPEKPEGPNDKEAQEPIVEEGQKSEDDPEVEKFNDAVDEDPVSAGIKDAEEEASNIDRPIETTLETVDTQVAGPRGLQKPREISDELSELLGQGKMMARTEVIKAIWKYIKDHNLQNPANKREVILDERMKKVFGCDKFGIFTMPK